MKSNMPISMCSWAVYMLVCLIAISGNAVARTRIYTNVSCPVTFVVPSDLELRDVVDGGDSNEKILCRISVVRKNKPKVLPLQKSFDDVRSLSDVVLDVKNVPVQSRLSELNFTSFDDHVSYKGKILSSDAIAMGYEILQVRPIEHYAVGHGDMYLGIQDFIRTDRKQKKETHSVSYVFLLGNDKYSIEVELTYRDKSNYNQIKKNSILKLLRSATFKSVDDNTEN
jgi:hypothetical protein